MSYSESWPETSIRMIFGFDIEWKPFMAQRNYTDHDAGLKMNLNEDKLDQFEFWLSNYTVLLVEWQNVIDVNSINSTISSNFFHQIFQSISTVSSQWSYYKMLSI